MGGKVYRINEEVEVEEGNKKIVKRRQIKIEEGK